MEIPQPRPVLWPLRPVESAAHRIATHGGRVVVTIEHAPLAGVTEEMLRWWYRHVEALGRDPENVLDIRPRVQELAAGRAVIAKRVLGTALVRLENEFADGRAGATYLSRLTIGDDTPPGRLLLNRVAHGRAFPPGRIKPWIRHHVEEIGNLENFLPGLFRERSEAEP